VKYDSLSSVVTFSWSPAERELNPVEISHENRLWSCQGQKSMLGMLRRLSVFLATTLLTGLSIILTNS